MKSSSLSRTVVELAMGIAILVYPVCAQETGAQQPTPTPTPAPAPTPGTIGPGQPGQQPGGRSPFPTDRSQQPGQDQNRFPDFQRPIMLSGKVVLDDGTPPPDSVEIERVCNGTPRKEAYTDSKGRFSFTLGENRGMFQDASIGSAADSFPGGSIGTDSQRRGGVGNQRAITERDLMGCELRAVLPGFRSDVVSLGGRRAFDNPDIGTIVLRRLANVEGTTISLVALQAPKDAKKAFDKGRELMGKKKLPEATKEFEKAVQLYPKYTTAWFELGRIHEAQKNIEEARKDYAQALAADPKYVNPYRQLAGIAFREQKWEEVADTTDRLIKLDPVDFPDVYFFNSVANYYLKKFDAAERSAREADRLDPKNRFPQVKHLLGSILVEKQDYAGAAEQIRAYLKLAPEAKNADAVRHQLSELEKAIGGGQQQQPQ
ncbi:MAG: tetratricopeptide repeat protein [Bryobacteraceae bacterium]